MPNVVDTPLNREIVRLMAEKKTNPQAVSTKAGLGKTFLRDLLSGKAGSPLASNLRKIADALEVEPGTLFALAGLREEAEIVTDPAERLLLITWRKLGQEDRKQVLDFVAFRLSLGSAEEPHEEAG